MGFTVRTGSDAVNLEISRNRAAAVVAWLCGDADFFRSRFDTADPVARWGWEEVQWMLSAIHAADDPCYAGMVDAHVSTMTRSALRLFQLSRGLDPNGQAHDATLAALIRAGRDYGPIAPNCGDGILNRDEDCDDSNTLNGDGCNRLCQREVGWECSEPGEPCIKVAVCGNGFLTIDETCDDGNTVSGDGCARDCMSIEDGWVCPVPGKRCIPDCGDSKLVFDEPSVTMAMPRDGDGCTSRCQIEPGYLCPTRGMPCIQAVCGNGMTELGETCDCGTDPNKLPRGCQAVNGLFYGDPASPGCSKT